MTLSLTFDTEFPDQPMAQRPDHNLREILHALGKYRVKARFFIQGRWAQANPLPLKDIAEAGHSLGNHGFYHVPFTQLDLGWVLNDLNLTRKVLARYGLDDEGVYRAPYGTLPQHTQEFLTGEGWTHMGWDMTPMDWKQNLTLGTWDARMAKAEGTVLLHSWSDMTALRLGPYLSKKYGEPQTEEPAPLGARAGSSSNPRPGDSSP